jgi:hypothetical protein
VSGIGSGRLRVVSPHGVGTPTGTRCDDRERTRTRATFPRRPCPLIRFAPEIQSLASDVGIHRDRSC